MSEPMTTVEIEDVLFSIRRLVSEDLRPTHKLVSAALQKGASKLILTPALRIVPDERSALPERADGMDAPNNLQTILYGIEAEAATGAVDGLPIFGSVRQSEPGLAAEGTVTAGQDMTVSDANFLTTAMSRINGLASVDGVAPPPQDTIEAVVAAVGAAVGPDEWELDGGEPAPQTAAWAGANWTVDGAAGSFSSSAKSANMPQQDANDDITNTAKPREASGQPVEADIQHSLAKGGEDAVVGADSIVFHDTGLTEPDTSGQTEPVDDDDLDDSAGFVSEELLREIVRDMIRDELQGTLGERITRNVRKLVRAEISRALASRDFDTIAHRG